MKKRLFAIMLCLMLVSSIFTGCSKPAATDAEEAAASVFQNGVVYTIDGEDWDQNAAQAMAVSADGTILFVGSNEEAEAWIGSETEVVDLEGKTVLPGLIDSHVHPPGKALTELFQIDLYTAFTKDNTMEAIAAFIEKNPGLDAYWGSGFNMGMTDENGTPPNKAWLDEVCPDAPMILNSNDGHNAWVNSAALEMLGIDASTKTPVGGNIHKDANGEPTGLLTDCGDLITVSQEFNDAQMDAALDYFFKTMNSWGYTSFSSAGTGLIQGAPIGANTFKEMEDAGELTMRVNLSSIMEVDDPDKAIKELNDMEPVLADSELIKASTAKYFIDGVVEGCTAYLTEPYTAAAGKGDNYYSEPMWEDFDAYAESMKKVLEEGYQIHVHSIGDAATHMTLDALEYAQNANGDADYRNVITHVQLVAEEDFARFGELKLIAAMQPFWSLKEPDWYDTVDALVLGEERAWKEYPFGSLKEGGAILTSSGDFPVTPVNNPFWAIEAGVTRNLNNPDYYGVDPITDMDDPTWLLNPDERLTLKDMVEAYTINGAYQMFRDEEIGSLTAGKLADFIIIDKDIMNTDPLDLDGIQVQATYLGGNQVFSAE